MAHAAQVCNELADAAISGFQRIKIEELTANVERDALHGKTGKPGQPIKDSGRQINGDAELVFFLTGRDLGVRSGINIRINTQRGDRRLPLGRRDLGEDNAFFLQLNIELADADVESLFQLGTGLAHARENDVFRLHTRRNRARNLAARDDVGTIALLGENAQDGAVGVGLDGKGNVRSSDGGNAFAENLCVSLQRRTRVDIDWRAHFVGNAGQRDVLGMEDAVLDLKMVHGILSLSAGGQTCRRGVLPSVLTAPRCVWGWPALREKSSLQRSAGPARPPV